MLSVVWFKRDLRVRDHAPLLEASQRGALIALYIYEPELLHSPEFDPSHLEFINASLTELSADLERLGGRLVTRVGEASAVLEELHAQTGFTHLYSHIETGNALTYARDRRVKKWSAARGVAWLEFAQHGILRGSAPRPEWKLHWDDLMRSPVAPTPMRLETADLETVQLETLGIPNAAALGLEPNLKTIQPGGSSAGYALLETFLAGRGREYQRQMSSPEAGWDSCSRLSPHISFGTVSLREVFQRNQCEAQCAKCVCEMRQMISETRESWALAAE